MRLGSEGTVDASGAASATRLTHRLVAPVVSFALIVGFVATAAPTAARAAGARPASGQPAEAAPTTSPAGASSDGVRAPLLPAGSVVRLREVVAVSLPVLPRDEARAVIARLAAAGAPSSASARRSSTQNGAAMAAAAPSTSVASQ